jgi:protein-arginine deiminase
MRRIRLSIPHLAAGLTWVALGAYGCSSSASGTGDGATAGADASADGGKVDAAPIKYPVIDLVVDANRDGVANPTDKEDQDFEATVDTAHGASFLPNLDDDDEDKVEDYFDEIINGDNDVKDMTQVLLQAWPEAPEGTKAKLAIDPADKIRVWTKLADGNWGLLVGTYGNCDVDANCNPVAETEIALDFLRGGLTLYIEGRDFRRSAKDGAWDGKVTMTLAVTDKDGKAVNSPSAPDGTDTIQLQVAPWLLNGNTSQYDHWTSLNWGSQKLASTFNADLAKADEAIAQAVYEKYSYYSDQWTQDWYQTGLVQVPAASATVHGMRVFNARPFSNGSKSLPIDILKKYFLGPDRAVIVTYKKPKTGSTYDSHGNHDLLPPFKKDNENYPLGRIITGSGVLPETWDFYEAQRVQGPVVKVDTKWLAVGHCDEYLSYVPSKSAKNGWKLLWADDAMAKAMFEKLKADGHGKAELFKDREVQKAGNSVKGPFTVESVLADKDIMQASQMAHVKSEIGVEIVKEVVGLTEDEIIGLPILSEDFGGGALIAWTPGTVNALVLGDHFLPPNPFGPVVNGVDVLAQDMFDRLGTDKLGLGSDGKGMKVHLIDDWYGYHLLMGEVHCGTNPDAPPNPAWKWWTVAH